MRALALMFGLMGLTGAAAAAELDTQFQDSDALSAQLVYETRFGGEHGAPMVSSFQMQIANEGQRQQGFVPLRAEYRPGSGQFLLNGVDVEQTLMAHQEGEAGGFSALTGFLPLVIVIGAASLIIVDGNDQDFNVSGSGGGP